MGERLSVRQMLGMTLILRTLYVEVVVMCHSKFALNTAQTTLSTSAGTAAVLLCSFVLAVLTSVPLVMTTLSDCGPSNKRTYHLAQLGPKQYN